MPENRVTDLDLVRWSEALAGIARTGLAFTESLYERERFEEVLKVAADIRVAADHDEGRFDEAEVVAGWLDSVGQGVAGYVTPKVAVGAIVGNDRERDPADPARRLRGLALPDRLGRRRLLGRRGGGQGGGGGDRHRGRTAPADRGHRRAAPRRPGPSVLLLVFHCRAVGGELRPHPLETTRRRVVRRETTCPSRWPGRATGSTWRSGPSGASRSTSCSICPAVDLAELGGRRCRSLGEIAGADGGSRRGGSPGRRRDRSAPPLDDCLLQLGRDGPVARELDAAVDVEMRFARSRSAL